MACNRHFVNYLSVLESLAKSVKDMQSCPDNMKDQAKKIVAQQADEALALKEEMTKCPSCLKTYEDSKP